MLNLILQSLFIGLITCIIGYVIFNLSSNKHNNNKVKPYGVEIAFFISGVIIYLFLNLKFCR